TDRNCEQVFHPARHLPQQKLLPFACLSKRCDVTSNLGGANDVAVFIPNRRNGQRDVDSASIFASTNRLVVLNSFSPTDALEVPRLLVMPIDRHEHRHRFADGFLGRVTIEALSTAVPTG